MYVLLKLKNSVQCSKAFESGVTQHNFFESPLYCFQSVQGCEQSARGQLIGVEAAANGFLQCTNHHHYVVLVLWSNFSSQEGGEVLLPMVIYRLGKSESSDRIAKPIH